MSHLFCVAVPDDDKAEHINFMCQEFIKSCQIDFLSFAGDVS